MTCTNQHFVGNGEVLIRAIGDNCGAAAESFRKVGDADELMISTSTDKGTHFESSTGQRKKSAVWINSTDTTFSLSVTDFNVGNLADLLLGTDSGAVAGASVIDEAVAVPSLGWVFVTYPGITSVTVTSNGGVTTLVEGVDYSVDSRNGGINILDMSNVTSNLIEVDYTHVGVEGVISALKTSSQDYELRFNGVNLNSPNKPVIVKIFRARVYAAEELSLIGQDITKLSFTGDILVDGNDDTYEVVMGNSVA